MVVGLVRFAGLGSDLSVGCTDSVAFAFAINNEQTSMKDSWLLAAH